MAKRIGIPKAPFLCKAGLALGLAVVLSSGASTAQQAGAAALKDVRERALRNEVLVAGGTFTMGRDPKLFNRELGPGGSWFKYDDVRPDFDEKAVREVTVSSFWMMPHEVTQGQWNLLMDPIENLHHGRGESIPVYNVNWYAAVVYANLLSEKDGLEPCYAIDDQWNVSCDFTRNGWRLPTEAEWEYAARGGRSRENFNYAGSDDPAIVAAFYGTAHGFVNKVCSRRPNSLGLYDMSGNVWEWVWDWYDVYPAGKAETDPTGPATGEDRIMRGGSWYYLKQYSRVTFRFGANPGYGNLDLGFRLVRAAGRPAAGGAARP